MPISVFFFVSKKVPFVPSIGKNTYFAHHMIFLQIGSAISKDSLYARQGSPEWAPCSHFANFFATSMMMRTKRNPMRKIFLRDHDLETWPKPLFFLRRWLHIIFGFFLATVIHYLTFFAKNFIKFSQNTFITTNLLFLELIYHSEDSFLMDWSLNQINAWYRHENISDYDTSSFLMRNWEKFKPVILFHSPMLCLIFIINASCSNTSGGLKSAASLRQ